MTLPLLSEDFSHAPAGSYLPTEIWPKTNPKGSVGLDVLTGSWRTHRDGEQARLDEARMGEECFNSYFRVGGMWIQVLCPEESLELGHWWLLPIRWYNKGQALSLTAPSRWGFWVWMEPWLRHQGARWSKKWGRANRAAIIRAQQWWTWGRGWNSGAYTPSQLAPSAFGIAPKSLPALSGNVIFFFTSGSRSLRQKTPWMELDVFPSQSRNVSSILSNLRSGSPICHCCAGLCGTERRGAPGAPTTVHSNNYTVVTVNFLLSLNHLNSACIILLLFM